MSSQEVEFELSTWKTKSFNGEIPISSAVGSLLTKRPVIEAKPSKVGTRWQVGLTVKLCVQLLDR